jgi:hypothetical protein
MVTELIRKLAIAQPFSIANRNASATNATAELHDSTSADTR